MMLLRRLLQALGWHAHRPATAPPPIPHPERLLLSKSITP